METESEDVDEACKKGKKKKMKTESEDGDADDEEESEDEEEEMETEGLTAKQKKLPKALQDAILKKQKKDKK